MPGASQRRSSIEAVGGAVRTPALPDSPAATTEDPPPSDRCRGRPWTRETRTHERRERLRPVRFREFVSVDEIFRRPGAWVRTDSRSSGCTCSGAPLPRRRTTGRTTRDITTRRRCVGRTADAGRVEHATGPPPPWWRARDPAPQPIDRAEPW